MQWPLEGVRVDLRLEEAKPGVPGTDIVRTIVLEGPLDVEQRERLLKVADACPVHKLLTGEVRVATALEG